MHLPDGIVTQPAALIGAAAAAAVGVGVAHLRSRKALEGRMVPRAGVMAAFIFAAQMVNFPIGFGVSGHLLGGALAAVILGPWVGMLVMAVVVIAQCLFFNDGGLASLGINVLVMAVIGTLSAAGLHALLRRSVPQVVAWFLAAWGSVVIASLVMAGVIIGSTDISGGVFFKALIGVHLLIGVGEGLITVAVLSAVARHEPTLVAEQSINWTRLHTAAGVAGAVLVVVFLSPFASSSPDGLEASLERGDALGRAAETANLPMPTNDYALAGVSNETLGGILAGLMGTLICLGVAWAIMRPVAQPAGAVVGSDVESLE